jgi:ATP-dependent RNA helicase DeaD
VSRQSQPPSQGNRATAEDDEKEASLTREKERTALLPSYKPPNGEFESFPQLPARTIEKLGKMNIQNLFPIQQNCFYPIFNREDVIARDLTGSGKTLAFALPVIEYLRKERILSSRKTQAIVLCPTRELAIQVSKVFNEIKHTPMEYTCTTVYGGVPMEEQTRQLLGGAEIFVGTTGRVLDHLNRGNIDFSKIRTVILDEADQMLKLGFKEDIEDILRFVKK